MGGAEADAALLRALAAWTREADLDPGLAELSGWAREAAILRRLAAAPNPGLAPGAALAVGLQLLASARTATRIALFAAGDPLAGEAARARFGAGAPISPMAKAEDAFAAARTGAVAVLSLASPTPWWGRLLAEPGLRVFAVMPLQASHGPPRALAVAATEIQPSGDDMSFWVTDAGGPAAVAERLGADGVAASLLASVGGLSLYALAGFYQPDDVRLARAPGRLTGVIGAAAAPLPL